MNIKYCTDCKTKAIRINKYDSFACKTCMIWIENKCNDLSCFYCSNRPDTLQNINWDDPWNT